MAEKNIGLCSVFGNRLYQELENPTPNPTWHVINGGGGGGKAWAGVKHKKGAANKVCPAWPMQGCRSVLGWEPGGYNYN